jgi:dienelactone hydrolase
LQLLENECLGEATAALAQLRTRAAVDPHRVALVGHSFGDSVRVLVAAGNPEIRAAVIFGGAAGSWNQSAALRARLLAALCPLCFPTVLDRLRYARPNRGDHLSAERQRRAAER